MFPKEREVIASGGRITSLLIALRSSTQSEALERHPVTSIQVSDTSPINNRACSIVSDMTVGCVYWFYEIYCTTCVDNGICGWRSPPSSQTYHQSTPCGVRRCAVPFAVPFPLLCCFAITGGSTRCKSPSHSCSRYVFQSPTARVCPACFSVGSVSQSRYQFVSEM